MVLNIRHFTWFCWDQAKIFSAMLGPWLLRCLFISFSMSPDHLSIFPMCMLILCIPYHTGHAHSSTKIRTCMSEDLLFNQPNTVPHLSIYISPSKSPSTSLFLKHASLSFFLPAIKFTRWHVVPMLFEGEGRKERETKGGGDFRTWQLLFGTREGGGICSLVSWIPSRLTRWIPHAPGGGLTYVTSDTYTCSCKVLMWLSLDNGLLSVSTEEETHLLWKIYQVSRLLED